MSERDSGLRMPYLIWTPPLPSITKNFRWSLEWQRPDIKPCPAIELPSDNDPPLVGEPLSINDPPEYSALLRALVGCPQIGIAVELVRHRDDYRLFEPFIIRNYILRAAEDRTLALLDPLRFLLMNALHFNTMRVHGKPVFDVVFDTRAVFVPLLHLLREHLARVPPSDPEYRASVMYRFLGQECDPLLRENAFVLLKSMGVSLHDDSIFQDVLSKAISESNERVAHQALSRRPNSATHENVVHAAEQVARSSYNACAVFNMVYNSHYGTSTHFHTIEEESLFAQSQAESFCPTKNTQELVL